MLMQMLYRLFCGINFTFLQNYNNWQLLTIGHDYQVPVDKHERDKVLPQTPDPLGGVKGHWQIFKFCNNSKLFFLLKFHMQTEVQ